MSVFTAEKLESNFKWEIRSLFGLPLVLILFGFARYAAYAVLGIVFISAFFTDRFIFVVLAGAGAWCVSFVCALCVHALHQGCGLSPRCRKCYPPQPTHTHLPSHTHAIANSIFSVLVTGLFLRPIIETLRLTQGSREPGMTSLHETKYATLVVRHLHLLASRTKSLKNN